MNLDFFGVDWQFMDPGALELEHEMLLYQIIVNANPFLVIMQKEFDRLLSERFLCQILVFNAGFLH